MESKKAAAIEHMRELFYQLNRLTFWNVRCVCRNTPELLDREIAQFGKQASNIAKRFADATEDNLTTVCKDASLLTESIRRRYEHNAAQEYELWKLKKMQEDWVLVFGKPAKTTLPETIVLIIGDSNGNGLTEGNGNGGGMTQESGNGWGAGFNTGSRLEFGKEKWVLGRGWGDAKDWEGYGCGIDHTINIALRVDKNNSDSHILNVQEGNGFGHSMMNSYRWDMQPGNGFAPIEQHSGQNMWKDIDGGNNGVEEGKI